MFDKNYRMSYNDNIKLDNNNRKPERQVKVMEKAKNVIEIKVCVDGMDELKKFIKKMEQEYGSTHTLVYKVDVFDVKRL